MNSELSVISHKSVLILGLGVEGKNTLEFLISQFPDKQVAIADKLSYEQLDSEVINIIKRHSNIRFHLGVDYLSCLNKYDVIIKSPGIPITLQEIQQAIELGTSVISNTSIFFSNCKGVIIGITGTKGKSTTSSLIYQILKNAGFDAHLVGNIGAPPLSLISKSVANTFFIFELSSFQLEGLNVGPHIAVLLNIFPEHLDYYGNFENYIRAKQQITSNQTNNDYLIYNIELPLLREIANKTKASLLPYSQKNQVLNNYGCFIDNNYIVFSSQNQKAEKILKINEVPLLGSFNIQNVLPAVAVGKILNIPSFVIANAIKTFSPLEHRLEYVGTYKGVLFFNDSIATVPEATIAAIESLGDQLQTILLGGFDRNLDYSELGQAIIRSKIRNLILFPTTGRIIYDIILKLHKKNDMMLECFFVNDMCEAVARCFQYTEKGKICLLSPASASFGLFADYKERGMLFKQYVQVLAIKP